jgi:DUF1016 N-terminal domain
MNENELIFYADLLSEIKERVRRGQQRAAVSANAEMILTYWDVGRMIAARQEMAGWGAGVIPKLAVDLKNDLPEEKGFSKRNIGRMIAFFKAYPNLPPPVANLPATAKAQENSGKHLPSLNFPPSVAKTEMSTTNESTWKAVLRVSWSHNVILLQKVKDLPVRLWYAHQAAEQGWSRDVLTAQISSSAHERQATAITNFGNRLPEVHAAMANGLLKDPYMFDFLTLEEPFHERELETGLLTHIEKPIGVSDYELTRALPDSLASSLSSIERLEEELSHELKKEADE